MWIITDSDGRVLDVSFGALISCGGQDGQEYTGSVPADYTSLEDWYLQEADKLYRWTVVDGELTLDSSATAPTDKLPAADYVVEQGTSGIWTYKKWASGEAELRATFVTTTAYAITTAYGNVYCYNAPFTIAFSGVPFSFVDYDTDSEIFVTIKGDGMDFSGSARLSSGNALTFFWMNPKSYTAIAGAKIQIIIKGRWK